MPKNRLLIYEPERWDIDAGEPAQEPVSIAEMKLHGVFESDDDDPLLKDWLKAAREKIENITHRALITKTFTYKIDKFPDDQEQVIELPGGKLQTLTSINYIDTAGVSQLWASSNYVAATERRSGRIGLAYGKSWPAVRERGLAVTIVYDAGYGSAPSDVPAALRTAVKMTAAELERHRELSSEMRAHPVPLDAMTLAMDYKIVRPI